MISTRSVGLLIDTVVCLTLAKWETVSGRFGGYFTNALGLFNSAECYRQAADILASERRRFDQPIRYLFYHALELYLKAFLRTDLTLDGVIRYGHRFRRLRGACTTRGLPLEQHEREVL